MRAVFFIFALSVFSIAQTPFEKSNELARKGNYERALAGYQQILESPNRAAGGNFPAQIHFNIGICLFHLNRVEPAIKEFERAKELKKNYKKAFYALGMAYSAQTKWGESRRAFLEALRLEKSDGEAWFDLGLVYLAEENFSAAAAAFQNSIKYKSIAAADAHNNLGVIFAVGGDLAAAVGEFRTALRKTRGKLSVAQGNLRFCEELQKKFDRELIAKLEFSRSRKFGV